MPPAARRADFHICTVSAPVPHIGGPVVATSTSVLSNKLPQAKATDRCVCVGGPVNFIVTGASTVLIDKAMAARMGDKTMHGPSSIIAAGSPDIWIDGPTAGCHLGGIPAATVACRALAAGRTSGSKKQSHGNCGIESCRQLINQNNPNPVDEETLYNQSIASGNANWSPDNNDSGSTTPWSRQAILANNGVSSILQDASMENIQQAVAEGKGVITSHYAGTLWGTNVVGTHAIVVTGLVYDENGNLTAVVTNDTGVGECNRQVDINNFKDSLRRAFPINVTTKRTW